MFKVRHSSKGSNISTTTGIEKNAHNKKHPKNLPYTGSYLAYWLSAHAWSLLDRFCLMSHLFWVGYLRRRQNVTCVDTI